MPRAASARRYALELAAAGAHVVAVARTVGALEELDDKIKAAGGSTTLVPLDVKDSDGVARLALALNERYGRLDVLIGNAGIIGPLSPLGHIEPKDWDNLIAVNITANWQLIRCMDPLLQRAERGPCRVSHLRSRLQGPGLWGPYAASKAALDALVRAYAAECATTKVCANLFAPGPTRTRMYLGAFPGVDPTTLPSPEEVAKAIVPLCLPDCAERTKVPTSAPGSSWNSIRPPKVYGRTSARPLPVPCRRHDPKTPSLPRNSRYAINDGGERGAAVPGKDRNYAAAADGGSRNGRRRTKGSR